MSVHPQTDVSRPAALPTANLRSRAQREQAQGQALVDLTSDEYLDSIEEEWNKRVDAEVETLVDGMVDLVTLASMADKDKYRIAQESYQAQCRAESMVRSANSLLSITHSMKLLLLLSDETQITNRREAELKMLQTEKEESKETVLTLLDDLIGRTRRDVVVPAASEDSTH